MSPTTFASLPRCTWLTLTFPQRTPLQKRESMPNTSLTHDPPEVIASVADDFPSRVPEKEPAIRNPPSQQYCPLRVTSCPKVVLHSREASTSVNVVLSGVADLDLKGKLLNGRWKGQVVRKVTTAMRQQRSVEEEEIILVLPKRVFLYGGGGLSCFGSK